MSEDPEKAKTFALFESMSEIDVRLMDANPSGPPVSETVRYSRAWLAARNSAKRDAREIETRRIAIAAVMIAAIAAIKEIKWLITSIISLFI